MKTNLKYIIAALGLACTVKAPGEERITGLRYYLIPADVNEGPDIEDCRMSKVEGIIYETGMTIKDLQSDQKTLEYRKEVYKKTAKALSVLVALSNGMRRETKDKMYVAKWNYRNVDHRFLLIKGALAHFKLYPHLLNEPVKEVKEKPVLKEVVNFTDVILENDIPLSRYLLRFFGGLEASQPPQPLLSDESISTEEKRKQLTHALETYETGLALIPVLKTGDYIDLEFECIKHRRANVIRLLEQLGMSSEDRNIL